MRVSLRARSASVRAGEGKRIVGGRGTRHAGGDRPHHAGVRVQPTADVWRAHASELLTVANRRPSKRESREMMRTLALACCGLFATTAADSSSTDSSPVQWPHTTAGAAG